MSVARGTVTVPSVRKRTPLLVRTTLPAAIRLVLVGSRFWNLTVPVALVTATRLPVALNVSVTETGTGTCWAGTTSAVGSGAVAVVSAVTVRSTGPTGSWRGVTPIAADGSSR